MARGKVKMKDGRSKVGAPKSEARKQGSVFPFVIRGSKIAGRGAFATRPIRKGERIIEYLGERVSHAVADERYDDHKDGVHHTFLFSVNRKVVIDASVDGNEARFINHSCDPNCESVIEGGRVFIDAAKAIRTGTELAYDYAYTRDGSETEEEEAGLYGCRCGAKSCRRTILAPLSKSELRKRAAALKRRHHKAHVHAREGQRA
ncbi:MAG: SET domain-containing protein [Gemmatimonadales bacterium]